MIGYGLKDAERAVIESCIRYEIPDLTVSDHPVLSELTGRPVFYPLLSENELLSLLEWKLPVMAFSGGESSTERTASGDFFYRSGLAAVWNFPDSAEPFIFPSLTMPDRIGQVFLISDDEVLSKILRQIFIFSGNSMRVDFNNNGELTQTLDEMRRNPDSGWPGLIIADLDSQRIDTLGFFHELKRIFIEDHSLRARTRLMILKDFSKPGLDVRTIASSLRFFAKRIFHPSEAVFAAIESGFYHGIRILPGSAEFRNIEDILYGPERDMPVRDPLSCLNGCFKEWEGMRRAVPFLWLQNHLSSDLKRSGAILKPEPDIDSRNFFHGVRRP